MFASPVIDLHDSYPGSAQIPMEPGAGAFTSHRGSANALPDAVALPGRNWSGVEESSRDEHEWVWANVPPAQKGRFTPIPAHDSSLYNPHIHPSNLTTTTSTGIAQLDTRGYGETPSPAQYGLSSNPQSFQSFPAYHNPLARLDLAETLSQYGVLEGSGLPDDSISGYPPSSTWGAPRPEAMSVPSPAQADEASPHLAENQEGYSEETGIDLYGSSSYLSIGSAKAINWLQARFPADEDSLIVNSVRRFVCDISQRTRRTRMIPSERTPEPPPEVSLDYWKEFFSSSSHASFGILDPSAVENEQFVHLATSAMTTESRYDWYALRNAVFALGAPLALARQGFEERQIRSYVRGYFENAISVHSQLLLHPRMGTVAVQALALMSSCAGHLSGSGLEFVFCTNAVQLAISLGLNRSAANATPSMVQQRSRLWWMLYCYEKHMAIAGGYQSFIDDDDISCPLPARSSDESEARYELLIHMIKHAQISSIVYKRLYSVKAGKQTAQDRIRAVRELDTTITQWRDSLPAYLQPGKVIKRSNLPDGIQFDHVLHVHYAYYGTVINIHGRYPWDRWGDTDRHALRSPPADESDLSARKAVAAARDIILTAQSSNIDADTAMILSFVYPMSALTQLFVHVLKEPTASTAPGDVALMDIAAGHFARIELATSMELDLAFVREMVKAARDKVKEGSQLARATDAASTGSDFQEASMSSADDDVMGEMLNLDFMDFMDFVEDNPDPT